MNTAMLAAETPIAELLSKPLDFCSGKNRDRPQPGGIHWHANPITGCRKPFRPKRRGLHHVCEQPLQLEKLGRLQGLRRQPLSLLELIEQAQ
jgi:hypothetical protein